MNLMLRRGELHPLGGFCYQEMMLTLSGNSANQPQLTAAPNPGFKTHSKVLELIALINLLGLGSQMFLKELSHGLTKLEGERWADSAEIKLPLLRTKLGNHDTRDLTKLHGPKLKTLIVYVSSE